MYVQIWTYTKTTITMIKATDLDIFSNMSLILCPRPTDSSSQVMSSDPAPIANLGQDELLSCYLSTASSSTQTSLTQVSVTWERTDLTNRLVYQFVNGAPSLVNQNSQFKDRTQLFPTELVSGNASLLLRKVMLSDQGVYTCTISSSGGGGKVNINLRTAGRMSLSSFTVFALKINTSQSASYTLTFSIATLFYNRSWYSQCDTVCLEMALENSYFCMHLGFFYSSLWLFQPFQPQHLHCQMVPWLQRQTDGSLNQTWCGEMLMETSCRDTQARKTLLRYSVLSARCSRWISAAPTSARLITAWWLLSQRRL